LVALEFPTGAGSQPIFFKLGDGSYQNTGEFYDDTTPYKLTVTMDFALNRWSASLDSTVLVASQPITSTNYALTLGNVDADWVIGNASAPGNDFMVFDEYQVAAAPAPAVAPGPSLQLESWSAQSGTQLRLAGQPGINYALEASTDLHTWTQVASLSSPNGVSEFTDTTASNLNLRFYRAR
jgi:hypothetical protein